MVPFTRPLRSLAVALELEQELSGLEPPAAFARLRSLSNRPSTAALLTSYGAAEGARLKALLRDSRYRAEAPLNKLLEDFLFAHLVVAMAHRYKGPAPKIHHWLPVAYMSHFSRGLKTQGRGGSVYQVSWASGEPLERQVADTHFTHGVDASGQGFFHLAMEFFFSRLEEAYGNEFKSHGVKATDPHALLTFTGFFVAQAARHPHPSQGFTVRTIEGLVEALSESLLALPPVFAQVAEAPKGAPMPLTPYAPPRLRTLTDGTTAMVFPLSSKGALVVSSHPLSAPDARRLVAATRTAVLKHASRTGGEAFGVRHCDPLP